jgi:hypothetical protein
MAGASSGARHVRSRKMIPGDEAAIQRRMGRVVPGRLTRVVFHASRLRHGSGISASEGFGGQRTQEGEGMAGWRVRGKLKLRERGLSQPSKKSYTPQKSGFVSKRRVGEERKKKRGTLMIVSVCLEFPSGAQRRSPLDSPETST